MNGTFLIITAQFKIMAYGGSTIVSIVRGFFRAICTICMKAISDLLNRSWFFFFEFQSQRFQTLSASGTSRVRRGMMAS